MDGPEPLQPGPRDRQPDTTAHYRAALAATIVTTFTGLTTGQWWLVPTGVTAILVDATGGGFVGGAGGGRIETVVAVTPGNYLYMVATGAGPGGTSSGSIGASNGGDLTAVLDVGTTMATTGTLLVIAGGAGGFGGRWSGSGSPRLAGGDGGGLTADSGINASGTITAGGGGTPSAPGAGGVYTGAPSISGAAGVGPFAFSGSGGHGGNYPTNLGGGGGGAGYYGGGGGAGATSGDNYSASGGGGSSWTHGTLATAVTHTKGYQHDNGYVTIAIPPVGGGGAYQFRRGRRAHIAGATGVSIQGR